MKPISYQTSGDQLLISINKKLVGNEFILNLIEKLRMELLAQKAEIDPSILTLGEEIKQDWWDKNKSRYIPPHS